MSKDEDYSFIESLKKFSGESSLHGVQYLSSTKTYSIRRVVWMMLIIVSLALFGLVAQRFVRDFYTQKVNTRIKVFSAKQLKLPTITICNKNFWKQDKIYQSSVGFNNDSSLFEIFKDMYITTSREEVAAEKYDRNNTNGLYMPNINSIKTEELFRTIAHKVYFDACFFEHKLKPCNDLFKVVKTDGGYCSQFNSNGTLHVKSAGTPGSLWLIVDIESYLYSFGPSSYSEGILIAINDAMEEPLVTKLGIGASRGKEVHINLEKTEISRQPPPADGNTSQCFDTTSLPNPLQYYTQYSYSACEIECETRYVIAQCGCREVLQPALGNTRTCTLREMVYCSRNATKWFTSDPSGHRSCHCLETCSHTKYSTQISSFNFPSKGYIELLGIPEYTEYLARNWVVLKIFFGKMAYTSLEEEIQFDGLEFLAYIGGTLMLCVGASTLTVVEFLEFVIISLVEAIRNRLARVPQNVNFIQVKAKS